MGPVLYNGGMEKMKELWTLFSVFFKIGLFTFGGGYAMLPLLQDELVKRRKWTTDAELLDYYSIGQCTPGIIAINVATFIGCKQKGKLGGCFSTFGMVTPSLIIICLIASVLGKYMDNQYLGYAFAGIRVAVTALIADTLIGLWKKGIEDTKTFAIFLASAALLFWFKLSAVWIVVLAALSGLALGRCRFGKREDEK